MVTSLQRKSVPYTSNKRLVGTQSLAAFFGEEKICSSCGELNQDFSFVKPVG
jgi:hypothetical protein